ncbi:unnamed protein product [Mycena citricolor]|uniref:DNA polymerase delta subunit 4 n=1 Tax=Mycena citricolor TaxID=2018698 RepID=A0AAD2Q7P3_9AGAR|nr:unnamed protein product [Mycena citricolor]
MPKASKSSLKQSTISFGASKRTASNNSKSGKPSRSSFAPPVPPRDEIEISDDEDDTVLDVIEKIDSEEGEMPARRSTRKAVATPKKKVITVTRPKSDRKAAGPFGPLFSAARRARTGQNLIHCQGQDDLHDVLRVFDLTYEFGPCIGVTRLERWERAQALGLNPPPQIKDMLLSSEGQDDGHQHCVFTGQV